MSRLPITFVELSDKIVLIFVDVVVQNVLGMRGSQIYWLEIKSSGLHTYEPFVCSVGPFRGETEFALASAALVKHGLPDVQSMCNG
jgi:hypothetical protein